jgi:hypothetical protein
VPDAFDRDALLAAVDLVGRTGARDFEIGYLNDADEPAFAAHGPQWWAKAQYRGERIFVEDHTRPDAAAEALAVRLLTGAKCKHCGGLVALADDGALAFAEAHLVDGTSWTSEEAAAAGQCRWRRVGTRWERGCESRRPTRREKRARKRRA